MKIEIPKPIDNKIDTNIHPANRIYNLTEEEMEKNKSAVEAHIKFVMSIGGMKDVEITTELKEKMVEDLETFWRDTPIERIAQD